MSELTQNIVVQPIDATFVVDNNNINFTPSDVRMNIYTGGIAAAGGNTTQLQYKYNGVLGGIANVTWNGSKLSLGNVANVLITGGTNGYVLQTDGTGNLSWTAQTGNGGSGNGVPGGANTQIQYNDSGNFGGNAGFTFNEVSGNVNMPNDLIVSGNVYGNIIGYSTNSNYANFAGTAFSIAGANVIGAVANATTANTAGTVTTNAQPNITSVGTLVDLTVSGNVLVEKTLSINAGIEKLTLNASAPAANINFDFIDQAIIYSTANATANSTLNFRGNSSISANTYLAVGDSVIGTYIVTTGTTPYGISNVQIDGSTQTVKWIQATTPTALSNSVTAYTFTIIKTATSPTYTVLGTGARYA